MPVDLRRVRLLRASLLPVGLRRVRLLRASLLPVDLRRVRLLPAGLLPVGLRRVRLLRASLLPVGLRPVSLLPASLLPVGLRPVSLLPASLLPVGLRRVRLLPGKPVAGRFASDPSASGKPVSAHTDVGQSVAGNQALASPHASHQPVLPTQTAASGTPALATQNHPDAVSHGPAHAPLYQDPRQKDKKQKTNIQGVTTLQSNTLPQGGANSLATSDPTASTHLSDQKISSIASKVASRLIAGQTSQGSEVRITLQNAIAPGTQLVAHRTAGQLSVSIIPPTTENLQQMQVQQQAAAQAAQALQTHLQNNLGEVVRVSVLNAPSGNRGNAGLQGGSQGGAQGGGQGDSRQRRSSQWQRAADALGE